MISWVGCCSLPLGFKAQQQSCLPSTPLIQYRRIRLSRRSPISPWRYWIFGDRRKTLSKSCLVFTGVRHSQRHAARPQRKVDCREERRTTWIEEEEEEDEARGCLYLRCLLCSLPSRWESEAGVRGKQTNVVTCLMLLRPTRNCLVMDRSRVTHTR